MGINVCQLLINAPWWYLSLWTCQISLLKIIYYAIYMSLEAMKKILVKSLIDSKWSEI